MRGTQSKYAVYVLRAARELLYVVVGWRMALCRNVVMLHVKVHPLDVVAQQQYLQVSACSHANMGKR